MNLRSLISQAAQRFAKQVAIVEDEYEITYEELNQKVNWIANGLLRCGLKKGDRVVLYIKNSHQYLEFRLALEKLGVVYVPINYFLSLREIEYILNDSGALAVVCDSASYQNIQKVKGNLPYLTWLFLVVQHEPLPQPLPGNVVTYETLCATGADQEPETEIMPDDLCSINYTSGTTGRPKGVMLTHKNWMEVYKNMLIDRDINCNDRLLHLGPLTHASGSYFMPFFLRGAVNVIMPGGFNLDLFFEYLEEKKFTAFTCVPTMLIRIMNDPRIYTVDKSALRMIGYGAAPMPTEQIKKALSLFGPILVQNYGQTEAYMTIAYLSQDEHLEALRENEQRLSSVGRPYTFVQVGIMDDDGNLLGPEEVGELVVKSEHVMKGYWNLPDETRAAFRNGWLLTGDLAKRDRDGYIYLLGRKKEMIISGGFNIYPREIEEVLHAVSGVLEAAVVGVADPDWGEKVVAFVVMDETRTSLEQIHEVCKQQLGFKKPKEYVVLESLPKNSIGKIDKKQLQELYRQEVMEKVVF